MTKLKESRHRKGSQLSGGTKRLFQALFLLLVLITTYSSLTPVNHKIFEMFWDKFGHAIGYFFLIATLDLGFRTFHHFPAKFISLFTYGLALEIIQHFIPGRTFSLLDLVANAVGLLAYRMIILLVRRIQSRGDS